MTKCATFSWMPHVALRDMDRIRNFTARDPNAAVSFCQKLLGSRGKTENVSRTLRLLPALCESPTGMALEIFLELDGFGPVLERHGNAHAPRPEFRRVQNLTSVVTTDAILQIVSQAP